jgi:integrase
VRVHLKGVHSVNKKLADGSIKTFHYHRPTRTRLNGEPGSPEFMASFAAAEKLVSDRHHGTFVSLVRAYLTSIEFEKLSPNTRNDYRRLLTAAESEFGDLPILALNDSGVKQEFINWRDKCIRVNGEKQADYRLQAVSSMLTWAFDKGKIQINHLKGFKHSYKSDRSQIIWTQDHIDSFMKVASVELQRFMTLALHAAQREGDLFKLKCSDYDGLCIRLTQGKTKMPVVIPCTKELKTMLDGMERKSIFILTTPHGRPWKKSWFSNLWKEATRKAGIEGRTFHDLRGTAITRFAEAGCSVPEIASISGHTLASAAKILEQYLARTAATAHSAIAKVEKNRR